MSEVQEVDAEVIEDDIRLTGALDRLIAEISERAETKAKEYEPHDLSNDDEYKQSKNERAGINRELKAIKALYDEKVGPIKDALKDADLRVKQAYAPLTEVEAGYKDKNGEYERNRTQLRKDMLREHYEDLAPAIALPQTDGEPLVPFDLIWSVFGQRVGEKWDAAKVGEVKAKQLLETAVSKIAENMATIEKDYKDDGRDEVLSEYFATLDYEHAVTEHRKRVEQRERLQAFDAEQESYREPIPAEPSDLFAELVESYPEMAPEPAPAPAPAPAPTPAPAPEPMQREQAKPWVVIIPSATKSQMQKLGSILSANGLTGSIKAGTISEVCAREVGNAR